MGAVIGFFTGGHALGIAGSGITGCCAGIISYLLVNSYYYDINFNVKAYAMAVIIGSVTEGIAGAFIVGFINKLTSLNNIERPNNNNIEQSHNNIELSQKDPFDLIFESDDSMKFSCGDIKFAVKSKGISSENGVDVFKNNLEYISTYLKHNMDYPQNVVVYGIMHDSIKTTIRMMSKNTVTNAIENLSIPIMNPLW